MYEKNNINLITSSTFTLSSALNSPHYQLFIIILYWTVLLLSTHCYTFAFLSVVLARPISINY